MALNKDEIYANLADAAFGKPLVSNMYRGLVAEVLVGSVLAPEWKWCSADWNGWDFQHSDGTRLEVKHSAALQTWSEEGRTARCKFGIATATGHYVGNDWHDARGRLASIYVFAHHPGTDPLMTDHKDPQQWRFYVLPAHVLPLRASSIGLRPLIALSAKLRQEDQARLSPYHIEHLVESIEAVRRALEVSEFPKGSRAVRR